jgi:hypothetical protein
MCACVDYAWWSWVDAEPLDQYQEQPSSEQFEQQPGEYEEGKYEPPITFKYNFILHLILYTYKDFLATFISLYISYGLHS